MNPKKNMLWMKEKSEKNINWRFWYWNERRKRLSGSERVERKKVDSAIISWIMWMSLFYNLFCRIRLLTCFLDLFFLLKKKKLVFSVMTVKRILFYIFFNSYFGNDPSKVYRIISSKTKCCETRSNSLYSILSVHKLAIRFNMELF